MARVAEPPQHQGERGEPEIGLGLAAAGGEEEQVHEFALETRGIRNPREVQQQESQLKGAPTRRLCDPFPGQAARERRGHGPVRHAEGVERVPILCEHEDAVLHPVRGKPGVAEQLLGGIPTLPGQVGQSAPLLVDPGPVAGHQGRQRLLGGGPVREVAERRHAQLHARRLDGFRLLHFGRRSPAGSKPVAGAVLGQLPVGGNSVAGGVFGDTRILEIRDELIPIVAGHHTRVGTSDERHLTADLDLDLKGERLISTAVGLRGAFVHQEQGDGAGSRRDPTGKARRVDRSGDGMESQPTGVGNRVRAWIIRRRQDHTDGLLAGSPLPPTPHTTCSSLGPGAVHLIAGASMAILRPRTLLDEVVVAPADGDLQGFDTLAHQKAQTHRRGKETLFGGSTVFAGIVAESRFFLDLGLEVVVCIRVAPLLSRRTARDQKPRQVPVGRPLPAPQALVRQGMPRPGTDQIELECLPESGADFNGSGQLSHVTSDRLPFTATAR